MYLTLSLFIKDFVTYDIMFHLIYVNGVFLNLKFCYLLHIAYQRSKSTKNYIYLDKKAHLIYVETQSKLDLCLDIICIFVFLFYVTVNSYGRGGTVSFT